MSLPKDGEPIVRYDDWDILPQELKLKRGWFWEWQRDTPKSVLEAIGRGYELVPASDCRVPVRRLGMVLMTKKRTRIKPSLSGQRLDRSEITDHNSGSAARTQRPLQRRARHR